jgi:hypothetical protein
MLGSRLTLWRNKSRAYPENILVYRDGVSEGQYEDVLDMELPQLRAACEKLYPPLDTKKGLPRITIIIVGKRHHTRLYATKFDQTDFSGNPKPGTVIDRGVTEAGSWDFFLQSHAAIQGTAKPAHYFVLHEEIFRQRYPGEKVADEVQKLTQALCYTSGRATKAISYYTPAYYADKLCDRAKCYFQDQLDVSDQSTTSGENKGGKVISQKPVEIHPRLESATFYI